MGLSGITRRLPETVRYLAILAGLAAMTLGAAAAQAFVAESRTLETKVRARLTYAWPVDSLHGYFPVQVELVNESRQSADVEVFADGKTYQYQVENSALRTVVLEPGERVQFELLVPNFVNGSHTGAAGVVFDVSGETMRLNQPSSGTRYMGDQLAVLAVGGSAPPPGTNDVLKADLDLMSTAYSGSGSRGGTPVSVGSVTWENLSKDWQAYSSLDAVVLSTADRANLDAHLEPILTWVRMGGTLLLVGTEDLDALRGVDLLEDAFDDRKRPSGTENLYTYGLGRIRRLDTPFLWTASAWGQACIDQVLDRHIFHSDYSALMPGRSVGPTNSFLGPFNELPLRGFLAWLMVFVILIGPLNLLLIGKLRRPALLLLSVPALSGLATLGILGYGILEQGLDVRVRDHSLVYLDQGRARVASLTMRDLFAGGFASDGLHPGPGTAVFPIGEHEDHGPVYRVERRGDAVLLAGDFLPSRQHVRQAIASEAASRLRVEIEGSGGQVVVRNATPEAIDELFYHALDGKWYRVESLKPGAEQVADAAMFAGSSLEKSLLERFQGEHFVPPGGYIARMDANPFLDDLGLEPKFEGSDSFVIGELGAGEAY